MLYLSVSVRPIIDECYSVTIKYSRNTSNIYHLMHNIDQTTKIHLQTNIEDFQHTLLLIFFLLLIFIIIFFRSVSEVIAIIQSCVHD